MNNNREMIIHENESLVLAKLTGPMILGIMGMIIFNLVDTYFVGRLGTKELAALSFTFPVVMTVSRHIPGAGSGNDRSGFQSRRTAG